PPALLVESNPGWRYQHLRQRRGRLSGLACWSPAPTITVLLRSWSNQTQDGDISTCASVAEDSQAWPAGHQ
ncbi:hypothetical protein CQA81_31805, partial [Klebsiella pneumoniae]